MDLRTLNPLPSDWRERLADTFYKLKAADHALQIEKDARRQRATEFAIVQAWKQAGGKDEHPLEGEDVSVSLGDNITYQTAGSGGMSSAAKSLLAAAVGAGGLYAWQSWPSGGQVATEPKQAVEAAADNDTRYQFRIIPELSGDR